MIFIELSTNTTVALWTIAEKMHMVRFALYLDMRKSLSRDPNKETSKPTGKRIEPDQLEWN